LVDLFEKEAQTSISHSVEYSLRKRLRTSRKTDYGMSFPVGKSWMEKGQMFFVPGIESRTLLCPAHSLITVPVEL
jgi:hypothetical protein